MLVKPSTWLLPEGVFQRDHTMLFMIDNEHSEEVDSIKYLGVKITNRLTFKKHLDLVVGRISKKLTTEQKR
jgi:hypothetical protein